MEFDPYETCPYDNVHRIRRSRMQFHMVTCSKNFPASMMIQCPFDARHKVNEVEFEYHKKHCQGRESVINYALHDTIAQSEQKILPIDVAPVGVPDEDWDDCANVKTYNPLHAIRDKPIVFPIIGLSKAKRKSHRQQERLRFNHIMENSGHKQNFNQPGMQTPSVNMQPEENLSARPSGGNDYVDEQEYKPLRRPFGLGSKTSKVPQDKKPGHKINSVPHDKNLGNKINNASHNKNLGNKINNVSQDKNLSNNINNVQQNKNQELAVSMPKDSKKSAPKVSDISNDSLTHSEAPVPKDPAPVLRKPKVDKSMVDLLSRTFEEFNVGDEDYKKKTESLDKEIEMLKKMPAEKKTKAT